MIIENFKLPFSNMKPFLLFALFALATPLMASRASHGIKVLRQPDGSSIEVLLHGDEHYSYYTTSDLRPLLRLSDGQLVPSTWEAVHQQAWANAHPAADAQSGPQRIIDGYPNPNAGYFPHQGQPRVCVVLLEFPDKPFTYSKEEIDEWLNGEQTQFESGVQSYCSVAGYFDFCSQGQFRPVFDVYGPYTAPEETIYYGYNQGSGTSLRRIVSDAVAAADADIDFAQYDCYNDDESADLVYVIFSGEGANNSGNKDMPWAMAGMTFIDQTYDGVSIRRCGISGEIVVGSGTTYQAGIGVICHEMSHTLGLPDLYDTVGNMPDWDNNGPEAWDLMDDGENLVNGFWPMPYVAWERDAFGWIELDELTEPQEVTLYPLNDSEGRGRACRITNPANPNEYYTLEVIPETGHYGWIIRYKTPQGGLLLTHVNYNEGAFSTLRPNNTYGHPNLTIVPADGLLLSSASIGQDRVVDGETVTVDRTIYRTNLGGDPYPGNKNVTSVQAYHNYTSLTGNTDEASDSDAEVVDMVTQFPITDIRENEDGSVSFRFGDDGGESVSTIHTDATGHCVYGLDGQCLGHDISALPAGLYVAGGLKVLKQ